MADNALDAAVEAALDNLATTEGIGNREYWRRIVRIVAPHIAARVCRPLVEALEHIERRADRWRECQDVATAALAAHKERSA